MRGLRLSDEGTDLMVRSAAKRRVSNHGSTSPFFETRSRRSAPQDEDSVWFGLPAEPRSWHHPEILGEIRRRHVGRLAREAHAGALQRPRDQGDTALLAAIGDFEPISRQNCES